MIFSFCFLSSVLCPPTYATDQPKSSSGADWESHFSEGVAYGQRGDWDKAIDKFKMADSLKPGRQEIDTNLSLAYSEQKDFASAVVYAEKAVKADPSKSSGYLALGIAKEGLALPEEAVKAYLEGARLDPKNPDIHLTLGNLYGRQGDFGASIAAYEKAIQAEPMNLFAHSNLAYIYEEKGELDNAMPYFEKAVSINPSDPVAWYDLGAAHLKKNEPAKAVEFLGKSFELDPNFYKACLSLALAYEDMGQLDKASEYYVKAMSLTEDPKIKAAILRLVSRSDEKKLAG